MRSPSFRVIVTQIVLLVVSICLVTKVNAQEHVELKVANTSSPQDTLKSFIDACNDIYEIVEREQYFDRNDPKHANAVMRILDCLDVSELPEFSQKQRASEVAVCIKEILDRVELPPWEEIPDLKIIEAAGGFEKLSWWRIPGTRITIVRVEEGPQRHEYLFSKGTVARAVEYFKQIEPKPYRTEGPQVSEDLYQWFMSVPGNPAVGAIVQQLPKKMQYGRTYGLANWKWPGLLIALLVALLLMVVAYQVYRLIMRSARERSALKNCLAIVFPIAGALIPLFFLYVCENYLTIRGTPLYLVSFLATLTMLLASLIVVFAAGSGIAEMIISSPQINPRGLNAQLIRIVSRLLSVTTSMVIILVGGQFLGIPVTTLLASAGVGGIAIALGAQDTLKTLFGTISLMADKPFRVGDRIVFEQYDGVVEDIGLRSTKLRLLTGHLVTFPNNQLASKDIENVGSRQYIRRKAEIYIPLDTSCEKVQKGVQIIRDKLDNHEGMDINYPPRVFFNEFGPNAFSIRFFYWYAPPDYWEFMAFSERLNFEIFRAFEAEGIQFSLPSRHSFWKKDQEQGLFDVRLLNDENKQELEN